MKRTRPALVPVVAVDRSSPTPLYRQLYEGFRQAILERRLRAGQRIPSTRTLAQELRVSRFPLLNAFEQLVAEGYFESTPGSGTFVASRVSGASGARGRETPRSSAPGRAGGAVSRESDFLLRKETAPWLGGWGAFRVSQPALDRFPLAIWSRLIGRQGRRIRTAPASMRYGDPMGNRAFREAVAAYLRTSRAVRCEADQIMVVSGSQHALDLTARVLLDPGSPVWVEQPGYGGARDVLRLRGARVVGVPVDDEGLNVAAGIERCPRARAAYVTPSHQYPMGMTMTVSRRLQLLAWARRSGSWVIEDDYDSEYRYESLPIASLQGLDRDGRVLYVGTFSKVLFPALRVGYLVIPPALVDRFAAFRAATDDFPPAFLPMVLADFIREGHFARHLRRMRALYRERRGALVEAIGRELGGALDVLEGEAGMHLVATGAPGTNDRDISVRAAREGLWAMPLSSCYFGKASRPGFVLGFGGTDVPEIVDGVRRLRGILLL